jgi:hypothetical protein
MNTDLAVDMHPAVASQLCPVAARSILSLDTAGIVVVFIGVD